MLPCLFWFLVIGSMPSFMAKFHFSFVAFFSASVPSPLLSFIKRLVTGFIAHVNSPRWSHLETLKLITSALSFQIRSHSQALKTRKLTYIGAGWGEGRCATIQATTTAFTRGKEIPSLFLIIKLINIHYHRREHFKSTKEKKIHL